MKIFGVNGNLNVVGRSLAEISHKINIQILCIRDSETTKLELEEFVRHLPESKKVKNYDLLYYKCIRIHYRQAFVLMVLYLSRFIQPQLL